MRTLIVAMAVVILLAGCSGKARDAAGTATATWMEDYDAAVKLAAEKKLPVLVDFTGSDWCVWCKRLDKEVFTQKAFADYANDNLVLLKLDFPKGFGDLPADVQQKREGLRMKYHVEGFPTILLIGADGTEIARTGYREGGAGAYVDHLKGLLPH